MTGFPANHNRIWTPTEERRLTNLVCAYSGCSDIAYFANEMGRTTDSITSRLSKMLHLQYYTSNEELLKLFRNKFHYYEDNSMNETTNQSAWIGDNFRIVMDGKTRSTANTEQAADDLAKILVRQNPTKDVFVFKKAKRYFTPSLVTVEDVVIAE